MNSVELPHHERRKYPRFLTNDAYILLLHDVRYSGVIGNISQGGAYLRTVDPMMTEKSLFQEGTVTLKLPSADITVQCSISFVGAEFSKNAPGTGIAFVDVDEQSAELISNHIKIIQQPL